MALPFLCPEPIGKGLMCISYITVKTCLSGNEVGHMCEWRVFQMTAEQFRDTQVLDLVPDFEGAGRPGTNTAFCTYALGSLSFLLLFLLCCSCSTYICCHPLPTFFLCIFCLTGPYITLPPLHSPFSHIYTLIFLSSLFHQLLVFSLSSYSLSEI